MRDFLKKNQINGETIKRGIGTYNPMTICIAAIGKTHSKTDGSESIVFATDHMLTLPGVGEFEHSIKKWKQINRNTIALCSGEMTLFDEIIAGASILPDILSIRDKIQSNMASIRDRRVKRTVFDRYRVGEDFMKELLSLPDLNEFGAEIIELVKNYSLGTQILLIGFIGEDGQIIEINEVENINTRDVGFDAIGSGGMQAVNTLLFQRHSHMEELKVTIYNVYKAKRNSEVAEGVGKETELYYTCKNGSVVRIDQDKIDILSNIYDNEMKFGKGHIDLNLLFDAVRV
jgi:hypothetical protein